MKVFYLGFQSHLFQELMAWRLLSGSQIEVFSGRLLDGQNNRVSSVGSQYTGKPENS